MPTNFNVNDHVGPATRPNKVVTAAEAVRLVHDGDTVAIGGPAIAIALRQPCNSLRHAASS